MDELKGKLQLKRSAWSAAKPDTVWAILMDAKKLHLWVPAVDSVERCDENGEKLGSVRVCNAKLGGRPGTIVERVTDLQEMRSITYSVDQDSFGMSKMFAHYSFRLSLQEKGGGTRITNETFYTPKNLLYSLMNVLFLKRQFSAVVDGILKGLADYADQSERRQG